MKYLLSLILLFPFVSFAQPCADEDTVRNNAVTLITATTARVNGTTAHFSGSPLSIQLRYVRVGQTDTATASSAGTNPLRNISGLQAGTQYVYYYKTICGSGSISQSIGPYRFTTLTSTVVYATERSTVFPYVKVDTGFTIPRLDTGSLYRAADIGGNIRFRPADSLPYYYNGEVWKLLAVDSAGILPALNLKVDSVTVSGDSLFYWVNGTGYGYILPANANDWQLTGNASTVAGTNFIGTTDSVALWLNTKGVNRLIIPAAGIASSTASTDSVLVTKTDGVTLGKIAKTSLYPTWQQTLTAGSTLTGVNDVDADGYDFRINDAGELGLAGDSITLSANAGSNHLHIKSDSSSLNKKISYESDLSSTFEQYTLVDKNYVDGPYIYGEYFNTTFPSTTLPTGMAKLDGAATYTQNDGMTATGGDGTVSNNYVRNTDTSSSNNYDYIWEFTLNTKFTDYSGQGKWFGKRSVNGAQQWSSIAMFRYGGSSSTAKIVLFNISGTGDGTAVDSSGTISMADGYTYRLKFTQIQNVLNVKCSRLSAGTEVESVYINYRYDLSGINIMPTIGLAAFGTLDATSEIEVTDFTINYNDIINADVGVLGTSITQGYRASSMNNHYLEKAFKGTNKTFVNYGQAGSTFAFTLISLPRMRRLNPDIYIIEAGVNNSSNTVADFRASLQACYDSIVTTYGKTMVILKDFADPEYDTIYYNFAAQYGLTLIDPAAAMVAGDYSDGVHPNDKGFDIYASFCKAALPDLFGSKVVNDRYSLQGLNDVTLSSPSNGQVLAYNSTSTKWENTTSGTGFVTLQPGAITNQTGGAGVTGYFNVGTGIGIGGGAVVGVHNNTIGNTVQDVTQRIANSNAAGTTKYLQLTQMGTTAYGVADWPSAGLIVAHANGGLVLSSYVGTIKFQTGSSYTTRGTWNSTGLSIGTTAAPVASAKLELVSTTQGFLPPRMTTTQRDAISSPATALQIFSTTDSTNYLYRGTTSGWQATLTGIRGSGTLDFGSIAHHSEEVLTISVTGAAEGDVVSLGIPNASNLTNVIFTAWVSAANTVSIKCSNLDQSAAKDPTSGTFKVTILKF